MKRNEVDYSFYLKHRLDDNFDIDDECAYQLLMQSFEYNDLGTFCRIIEEYPGALGSKKLNDLNENNLLVLLSLSKTKESLEFIKALIAWDSTICKWEIEGQTLLDISCSLKNKGLFKLLIDELQESIVFSYKGNKSSTRYSHVLETVLESNEPEFTMFALQELESIPKASLQPKGSFENFNNLSKSLDLTAVVFFSAFKKGIVDLKEGLKLKENNFGANELRVLSPIDELFVFRQVEERCERLIKKQIELLKKAKLVSEPNLRSYILLLTSFETVFFKMLNEGVSENLNKKAANLIENEFAKYLIKLSDEYLHQHLLKSSILWDRGVFGLLKRKMLNAQEFQIECDLENLTTNERPMLKEKGAVNDTPNGNEKIGPYGVLFFTKRLDLDCYVKSNSVTQTDNYCVHFLNTVQYYSCKNNSRELFTEKFFYKRNSAKIIDVLFLTKVKEHYELFKENEYVKRHPLFCQFEQIFEAAKDGFTPKSESFFEAIKLRCATDKLVKNDGLKRKMFAI